MKVAMPDVAAGSRRPWLERPALELPDLVPVHLLGEYVYCPRQAYIHWVDREFRSNYHLLDGKRVHERIEARRQIIVEEEDDGEFRERRLVLRSVYLSAPSEGLIASVDLLQKRGDEVEPVEYKRSSAPRGGGTARRRDAVQLCAQALVLRENGFTCERGYVYYAGSRRRVEVKFDEALVSETREVLQAFRRAVEAGVCPPPLEDAERCTACSLIDVCLPEETRFLAAGALRSLPRGGEEIPDGAPARGSARGGRRRKIRPILPARSDAIPLYVQTQGMKIRRRGNRLVLVEKGEEKAEVRLADVSQVCLFGNVTITPAALHECCTDGIPVCHFSHGGWFYGVTLSIGPRNAWLKSIQFAASSSPEWRLRMAKRFVRAKIHNQRTFLKRNGRLADKRPLRLLAHFARKVGRAVSLEEVLGMEGSAARVYFSNFERMFKSGKGRKPTEGNEGRWRFAFAHRSRRPPLDPVNAMLSYVYSLLTKDCTIALFSVGFDPFQGFFHAPRFGRPSLALDFMEEFRPIIADSVVVSLINAGSVSPSDFQRGRNCVLMKKRARKLLIEAYERRLAREIAHPVFGYRISYRRILEVQARLLARYLAGEIDEYPAILPR